MSRIGKSPIKIPSGVKVNISGQEISVEGSKGKLKQIIPGEIKADISDNQIVFSVVRESKNSSALWGLSRSLVNNMVSGVSEGFTKKLEIEGVGYKAALSGKDLVLNIGFSHPVMIKSPEGIEFKVEKNTIIISGIDKYSVGQIAAKIRAKKKPEPYKGKGIRYSGEVVRRKAGKKAATSK